MLTQREFEIALLEVEEKNQKLVEEWIESKLGSRGTRDADYTAGDTGTAVGTPAVPAGQPGNTL